MIYTVTQRAYDTKTMPPGLRIKGYDVLPTRKLRSNHSKRAKSKCEQVIPILHFSLHVGLPSSQVTSQLMLHLFHGELGLVLHEGKVL